MEIPDGLISVRVECIWLLKHATIINDQFPISTTKEINVDDQKAPEAQSDKNSGITTWTITLQPGQEKKLELSYTVKYPKDRKVVLE